MMRLVSYLLVFVLITNTFSNCKRAERVERLLEGTWDLKGCKNLIYSSSCPKCIPSKITFLEGNMYYIDSSGHYYGSSPIGPYSYSYSNGYLQLENYSCRLLSITSPKLKIESISKNRMVIRDLGEFEFKYTLRKIDE